METKCQNCNIIFYTKLPENKIYAVVSDGVKMFERICECNTLPFKEEF